MRLIRHRLARIAALIATVVWVFTTSAGAMHEIVVRHVRCAEHGELSEVRAGHHGEDHGRTTRTPGAGASAGERADHGPVVTSGDAAHPDHGCAELLGSSDPTLPVLGVPPRSRMARPVGDPLCDPGAPRGPPLEYAPKTSPPEAIG
jgi:hypothetical protein